MERLAFLQGIEESLLGKSIYMAVGNNFNNLFGIFNHFHPDTPQLKEDWLLLQHFINLSDAVQTTSRIISGNQEFRLYPCERTLESGGVSLISKRRVCVITCSTPNSIDYSCSLFTENFEFLIYALNVAEAKFRVVTSPSFSLNFISQELKKMMNEENPTILLLGGLVSFRLILESFEIPDYLLFTELLADTDSKFLVGTIEYKTIMELYEIHFISQNFINQYGEWQIRLFKKKALKVD